MGDARSHGAVEGGAPVVTFEVTVEGGARERTLMAKTKETR